MKVLLLLAVFTSCASMNSNPPIWQDEYGIVHVENPTPGMVAQVEIIAPQNVMGGCKRLRDIYLSGSMGKEYQLRYEAAKMMATHVTKVFINNLNDIQGVAYDCSNYKAVSSAMKRDRMYMKQRAMQELERRRGAAGKDYGEKQKVTKGAMNNTSGIPMKFYSQEYK
jgi:hypothetical protein